ncbi:MAG: acyloxyacyl hydrolase [Phycisphaerales bacterium]
MSRCLLLAAALVLAPAPVLWASGPEESFSLGLAGAMALGAHAEPVASEELTDREPTREIPRFGAAGSSWLSLSAGVMFDNSDNTDYSLRLTYHQFLAKDFEINLGLTGWLHDQPEQNEASGSFDLGFRYHFLTDPERGWSVYADTGIGLMLSTGNVPERGTSYNFTPRAGVGLTMRLPENLGGGVGARLDLGVGWQHYSNASTSSSRNNPARDSLIIRLGVIFPF